MFYLATYLKMEERGDAQRHLSKSALYSRALVTRARATHEANGEGKTVPSRCQVLAIAGCTNSGKSTIAQVLANMMVEDKASVEIIHQDDFFLPKEQIEAMQKQKSLFSRIRNHVNKVMRSDGADFYYDYDSSNAIDFKGMTAAVREAIERNEFVIVEGNMLTEFKEIIRLFDLIIFLTLDQSTCRRRRDQRAYDPPDTPGYFDQIAWPAYQQHLKTALALARDDKRIAFLDVSSECDQPDGDIMMELIHSFSDDVLRICHDKLNLEEVVQMINSPSCGATSVFVGTTRDTFNGKKVARLDYESYDEMAYKELRKLCKRLREQYRTLERVIIVHRVGEVPVGEASVIIATAAPHRADAMHAAEMAIHELKRTVPIWKKEVYTDGTCSWKENGELCCANTALPEEKNFADGTRKRDANRKVFWLRSMMRQMGS